MPQRSRSRPRDVEIPKLFIRCSGIIRLQRHRRVSSQQQTFFDSWWRGVPPAAVPWTRVSPPERFRIRWWWDWCAGVGGGLVGLRSGRGQCRGRDKRAAALIRESHERLSAFLFFNFTRRVYSMIFGIRCHISSIALLPPSFALSRFPISACHCFPNFVVHTVLWLDCSRRARCLCFIGFFLFNEKMYCIFL